MKYLSRRMLLLAGIVLIARPKAALAHAGAHDEPILVDLIAARRLAPGEVELDFAIYNITPEAVTLRGMWSSGAQNVSLSRLWHLLGWVIPRPVDFLRLEPGELVTIAPPDFSAVASGLGTDTLEFDVELDFGPVGRFIMPVSLPD